MVLEQIADFPCAQLMEHVLLSSSLVALQLPPSEPAVEELRLSAAFPPSLRDVVEVPASAIRVPAAFA